MNPLVVLTLISDLYAQLVAAQATIEQYEQAQTVARDPHPAE